MTIRAYWYQHIPNFGDLLTRYWIEKLTGVKVDWIHQDSAQLFGCGSIIERMPENYSGIILGSGMMHRHEDRPDLRGADIRAIRGPLTAERIGTDAPYGDFGLLFYLEKHDLAFKSDGAERHPVGHLPHYAVPEEQIGHRIDIMAGVENVVAEVARCDRLISSSLHGIVLADALGIENKWIESRDVCGDGFKFRDYAASLGEDIRPGVWRLGDQTKVAQLATRLRGIVIETVQEFAKKDDE